ncbi:MAG: L,D-transpeptidase family protein [Xanthobacteraceae bacterium]
MARHSPILRRTAHLVVASLVAVIAAGDITGAAGGRQERFSTSIEDRTPGEPVMAIVSLQRQQITIYDSKGWILRAPVSSGQKGRETPAGIFSIIEKEAEHYSNLYDDAYMPHMERLTWSGIALHGGVLPGHPASHGCIRLPYEFAERLFGVSTLGMRVIVAPADAEPVAIAHPALFPQTSSASAEAAAKAAAAEADEAASKADQARSAAATASREAGRVMVPVRAEEILKRKADAQLAAAERAVDSAASDDARQEAEGAKEKAAAAVAELETEVAAAKAQAQAKLDAVASARQAAAAAGAVALAAVEKAQKLARNLEPVSVFISRKTQHLYLRQSFQPILDIPVTIRDPDRPIGTHVFTAAERAGDAGGIQWTVVSLNHGRAERGLLEHDGASRSQARDVEQASTDQVGPEAALDRITIPPDTLERIAEMMSPRSSLIISDESLSSETGRGTEFVVLLSGEPQGGIATRRRSPASEAYYGRSGFWGSSYRLRFPFSTW